MVKRKYSELMAVALCMAFMADMCAMQYGGGGKSAIQQSVGSNRAYEVEMACDEQKALDNALQRAAGRGDTLLVKQLIARKADVNYVVLDCEENQWSALTFACNNGYADVVKELLIAKADVATGNRYTQSGIATENGYMSACKDGHVGVVKELLAVGIKPDGYPHGLSPLEVAVKHNHIEVVRALLAAKADVNKSYTLNEFPLKRAMLCEQMDIARELIHAGALVDRRWDTGDQTTALHVAVGQGSEEKVRMLIFACARHDIENALGKTAFDMANSVMQRVIMQALQDRIDLEQRYALVVHAQEVEIGSSWASMPSVMRYLVGEYMVVFLGRPDGILRFWQLDDGAL